MITIKPKKCKGTSHAIGYGCGDVILKRVLGLCSSCYGDWILTTEKGQERLAKATLKATKPREDLEKAIEEKNGRKKLMTLLVNVRNMFHKYVRLRDKGEPCIACGVPWNSNFQASHYFKAELYSMLKFHEDNVHGGCMECNLRKEGNLSEYAVRLRIKIGDKRYRELYDLAELNKKSLHHWDRGDLEEIRKLYKFKIEELK